MAKGLPIDRIAFLAKQFNVIDDYLPFNLMFTPLIEEEETIKIDEEAIAIITKKIKKTIYEGEEIINIKRKVHIFETAFINLVRADPSSNKEYTQWLLTVFSNLLKNDEINEAKRFYSEDLPLASKYIEVFELNKRKDIFKTTAKQVISLVDIADPTNINQYKSLSQLYDVTDPFIERGTSDLEVKINKLDAIGMGKIVARDRNFTVFVPLTLKANYPFEDFAGWCTARRGNSMFSDYTGYLDYFNEKSKLYIIIDNKTLRGESKDMWQLHFESNQLHYRNNSDETKLYEKIFSKSEVLSTFFHKELLRNAKKGLERGVPNKENRYIRYLVEFGHSEIYFDLFEDDVPSIAFRDTVIRKLPRLKRFTNVSALIIINCRMDEIGEGIIDLTNLRTASLMNNNISEIPSYISQCKNLNSLNLFGNRITKIADDISMLDPINGGNLFNLSIDSSLVGEENFNKLKKLLPSVRINDKTK